MNAQKWQEGMKKVDLQLVENYLTEVGLGEETAQIVELVSQIVAMLQFNGAEYEKSFEALGSPKDEETFVATLSKLLPDQKNPAIFSLLFIALDDDNSGTLDSTKWLNGLEQFTDMDFVEKIMEQISEMGVRPEDLAGGDAAEDEAPIQQAQRTSATLDMSFASSAQPTPTATGPLPSQMVGTSAEAQLDDVVLQEDMARYEDPLDTIDLISAVFKYNGLSPEAAFRWLQGADSPKRVDLDLFVQMLTEIIPQSTPAGLTAAFRLMDRTESGWIDQESWVTGLRSARTTVVKNILSQTSVQVQRGDADADVEEDREDGGQGEEDGSGHSQQQIALHAMAHLMAIAQTENLSARQAFGYATEFISFPP